MKVKIRLFGVTILFGCYRVTGGPFVTIGHKSYSLRGITDLDKLAKELGFD